jgi:hypothetical protein
VQPLVDCHYSVWKRINNAVGLSLPCIVLAEELVRQTIKDIWKNEHEFLYDVYVAGVHNGALLFALFIRRGKSLEDSYNGLIRETHQSGVLRIQTAAQVV